MREREEGERGWWWWRERQRQRDRERGRERERERVEYEDVCMRVAVWEAVIWCMGVGVKADRMRIAFILY